MEDVGPHVVFISTQGRHSGKRTNLQQAGLSQMLEKFPDSIGYIARRDYQRTL